MPTSRRAATKAEAAKPDSNAPATGKAAAAASSTPKKTEAKDDKPKKQKQQQQQPRKLQEGKSKPKLPPWVQFPLAATLSFAMASLGYSLLGEMTKGELAAVSRSQDTWGEVGILAGWRLVELALGWFGNLDSLDVATLDLLSHGPSLYLLTAFYNLSPVTALSSLAVDITSAAVPFYLLRPLAAIHTPSAKLPNRELADLGMQVYTTALSAGIYTVTIVLSLRFLLPSTLVVYFSGLPTLEPAYTASYPAMLPLGLLFGAAASNFIYAPFATTGKAKDDAKIGEFDPAAASLRETVAWNFWGYTAKTKVIVRRTAVTVTVTAINTYLACTMTIFGIESTGAAAYAAVWVMAALCSGLALGFVGGD